MKKILPKDRAEKKGKFYENIDRKREFRQRIVEKCMLRHRIEKKKKKHAFCERIAEETRISSKIQGIKWEFRYKVAEKSNLIIRTRR